MQKKSGKEKSFSRHLASLSIAIHSCAKRIKIIGDKDNRKQRLFFSCLEEKERESQKGKERKIKAITNSVIGGNNILSKKKKEKRKY